MNFFKQRYLKDGFNKSLQVLESQITLCRKLTYFETTRTTSNNRIDATKAIRSFIICIFMNYINCIIIL